MSEMSKISAALPAEPFHHAISEVNEWRGACLYAFSCAEAGVSECLLVMSRVPELGQQVRLRHLMGQRYEDLLRAVSAGGPFENTKSENALTRFREHDGARTLLCHGVSEVTLGKDGRWTVICRVLSFKSRSESRETHVFAEEEAKKFRNELSRDSQRLCSHLRALRGSLQQAAN